eukprot:c12139_g1_i1 orf=165-2747(+)
MAGIDLRKACLDCFAQLAGEDVKDALVYLDAGAGEAFHFLGGLSALLTFEPRAVCSLESASPDDAEVRLSMVANDPVQKMLVITTQLLSHAHQYIHRCLQAHSSVKVCTVLTSLSEEAHAAHPNTFLGPNAFSEYKRWLVEDFQTLMQKGNEDHSGGTNLDSEEYGHTKGFEKHGELLGLNLPENAAHAHADSQVIGEAEEDLGDPVVALNVKVKHFPMIICPLMSTAFVFPSNGTLAGAPLAEEDSPMGIGLPYTDGRAAKHDDDGIPIGGTLLAHFLHHLGGQLGLKFDVFTLGPLSKDVGKQLTELSGLADVSVRSRKPAGLLLIDRTLDLITPSSHGDSLMDRVFASSSRRSNGHDTQKLSASSNAVKRRPLDIRVPNGASKELCALMSNFENLQSVIEQTSDQKGLNDCKLASGTISKLHSLGSSLFDTFKNQENGRLDLLLEKRVKDSLFTIGRWLQEAVSSENMEPPDRRRSISAQEIHSLCDRLSRNIVSAVRYADLIQMSKAVEMALDPVYSRKWDGLANAERVLSMSVGDSSQSVASQICDVVHQSMDKEKNRSLVAPQSQMHKLFTLEDALTLAIAGYALAGDSFGTSGSEGPFSREEERELKQAVIDAILEGTEKKLGFLEGLEDSLALHRQPKSSEVLAIPESHHTEVVVENNDQDDKLDFSNDGWEAWDEEDDMDTGHGESVDADYGEMQLQLQVRDRVDAVFRRLHRVSEARRSLQLKAKAPMLEDFGGFGGSPHRRRSLIFKVLSLIFTRADVPGMEHHSSFVGRILKSGLGRFGLGQAKPKLSDNKIILIFVIGGINGVEVCEAKEAQAIYKMEDEIDIILGGTTFLTPDDVFDLLIGSATYS